MVRVLRRYSEAFKRSVVAEVESGRYTAVEAAAAHQVHFASVYQWLKQLGRPDSQTRIVRIEMPDERNRIKQLEQEKRALESALAQAHMKILLLESTVEVLEEQTGQGTKKKPAMPSSSEPRTKGLSLSYSCRMLKISRQAMYQRRRRQKIEDVQVSELLPRVLALRQIMPRVGGRKLLKHLGDLDLGRDKFFEILRHHGLLVKRRRHYAVTTNSKHALPVYPNLLPQTPVDAPNRVWVADQTYIRLRQGFCYLSLVTDLYSRKIVGYNVAPTLEATGPLNALRMAFRGVKNPRGLVHHSDRGKQYCSADYVQILTHHGCRISMTAPRRPDQNATAERVNGILKSEFFLDSTFNSIEDVHYAVKQTIYIYNNIRLHLSLGMMTPSLKYAA